MKVVIVAEVHDDCNVEDLKADVRFYSKDKLFFRRRRKVKKMPEKRILQVVSWDDYGFGWDCGFDACIDEMLGETER